MKEILFKISEEVLNDLKDAVMVKQMAGNMYGIGDAVLARLVEELNKGKDSVLIDYKKEGK